MTSKLFEISLSDVTKGLVTAVLAAIVTTVYSYVSQGDFNLFTADWSVIFNDVFKVSFSAFLAYLMKNYFTSSTIKTETVVGIKLDKN